ncbi:hypothetical protein [Flammeovirga kamogawensis]|uniref:HNH endonuclease n=1 Tax=Flammeovirga kamogawensis TaxID=373891 RepID=A0ABX8H407_9BACT|nr:hypothetical protein [Flammeovirga kamogawensis]MBB6461718.1 hypothetical protein [Flammeovirga kamogawensis]QWG10636.1 hypothetical protein KM029_24960 [Flammeovirga kamogawensis]TRX63741.1 hypothetical protein EO216_25340 [Flammeovirga kamogawensis]
MLSKIKDESKCWWCNSSEYALSGEHKIKKTDIEQLFGKGDEFKEQKFIKVVGNGILKGQIQSPSSNILKFNKKLCSNCNGSRSQQMDRSYEKFMNYYNENKEKIKTSKIFDLGEIYESRFNESYLNLKRYFIKHICCKIVDDLNLLPPLNLINFLNGKEELKDVKIIFNIKPYAFSVKDPFTTPYISSLDILKEEDNTIAIIMGWFTVNQLSINYIIEKNINCDLVDGKIIDVGVFDYKGLKHWNEIIDSSKKPEINFKLISDLFENYPFNQEKNKLEKALKMYKHLKYQ